MVELKALLDELVLKFNRRNFIHTDPVKYLHLYRSPEDIEVVGLMLVPVLYGRVENIFRSCERIISLLGDRPRKRIELGFKRSDFEGFVHRHIGGDNIWGLSIALRELLSEFGSIAESFRSVYRSEDRNIKDSLTRFVEILKKRFPGGTYKDMLLPSPERGSACKRLNLYLRWMVRNDEVDFGIWNFVRPSQLIIPLDAHIANIARRLKLTKRKSNDWRTAEEITEALKRFDPHDPLKYDFALTRLGILGESSGLSPDF